MRSREIFMETLPQKEILREGFFFIKIKRNRTLYVLFEEKRMQINVTADYAIRAVLYLAIQNKVTASRDIASAMGIHESYILKTTNKLL